MIMEYNVNFIFSDDSLPRFIKDQVAKDFMKMRSKAVDLLNPRFAEWNASYTEPVNGEDDMVYNAYISEKENGILQEFNKQYNGSLELYADEYGDIAGKFKLFNQEYTIHMTLEPI